MAWDAAVAECRDCGRQLDGGDGYFELCSDHDRACIVSARANLEVADVAIAALHWATRALGPMNSLGNARGC